MTAHQDPQEKPPRAPGSGETLPISFDKLANGKTEVTIEHDGQHYRLRVTKNGKLLLNK